MRNGGDKRGSSRDRYARKTFLLFAFGDGNTAPCFSCGRALSRDRLEADRIIPGGSYRQSNIRPACRQCNAKRGNAPA